MYLATGFLFAMIFPSSLIYLLPIERTDRFWSKFLSCFGAGMIGILVFLTYFPMESDWIMAFWVVRPFLAFGITTAVIYFSIDLDWKDTVYYSIWAYLTRELCYEFSPIITMYFTPCSDLHDLCFLISSSITHSVIYACAAILIAPGILKSDSYHTNTKKIGLPLLLTALVAVIAPISMLVVTESTAYRVLLFARMICIFFVLSALFVQNKEEKELNLQRELETQRMLWEEHTRQMESARRSIKYFSEKYHDMKRYLADAQAQKDTRQREQLLAEVEDTVGVFEHIIRTGNEVLDVVLTEKSLYCASRKIVLSCVVDGALLKNMDAVDLYELFGCALDDAIKYVLTLEGKANRVIMLSTFRVRNMVKIRIESSCEEQLEFEENPLKITKAGGGKYERGLQTIQRIADKYGGYMSVETENGIFIQHILLPVLDPQNTI